MKRLIPILLSMTLTGVVNAADVDDLDVTIDLIGPGEADTALMNRIELPFAASEQARERAQHGLDTANDAREKGRGFGQEMAANMRQSREQIRDNIAEKQGHKSSRPDNPGRSD